MKFVLPRRQKWFLVIVGVIFLLYQGYHLWTHRDITWNWKEETQLADGSHIWIERDEVREVKGGGEPFSGLARGTKVTRIRIPDNQGKVVWESTLAPMILERGVPPVRWTVIAEPVQCGDHYKYGSPTPPYIEFDYANRHWIYKSVSPTWYGKRANLLIPDNQRAVSFDGRDMTAEQVKKFNDGYGVAASFFVVKADEKSNCYR
jgi:hypothetical protein